MGRRWLVVRRGAGLERRGEARAQGGEFGFKIALATLLTRELVAERLQRHLHMGDTDFKFGQ